MSPTSSAPAIRPPSFFRPTPTTSSSASPPPARAGFDVSSEQAVAASWLAVYRDAETHFDLYGLAEKLVDLDDALATWRHKHMLTIERIIGMKTGTGGSAGVAYLKTTLDKRAFPALWALRTEI